MALELDEAEQEALLEALGGLVEVRGPAALLAAPIEPTEAFFPDRFTPDAGGARVVAERLLGYAGLTSHRAVVEVRDGREVAAAHRGEDGAAAWFTGVEGFRCFFGVDRQQLDDGEALVAALAHEVAHAFRQVHALAGRGAMPEEPATDATTVFLGFGVLTTNATYRYRTHGVAGSSYAGHWIKQSRLGYLPPQAMAFLLAAQALGRRAGRRERQRLAGLLETNQAAAFGAAHAALARREAEVLRQLRLRADRQGTPAPRPERHVEPPVAQVGAPAPAARTRPAPATRRPTFRVPGHRKLVSGLVGACCAVTPFAIWAMVVHATWPLLPGLAAAAWLGARWGRRRPDRCSDPDCQSPLPTGITACPGCSRAIGGAIARPEDRLEAEERLHSHEGLAEDDQLAG